jgi:hypothetical protein
MTARRSFVWLLVVLTITLATICLLAPVTGDGWGHYWAAREPLTWEQFGSIVKSLWFHGNPRWGQLVLVMMSHAPLVAGVVSGLVIVGLLLLAMTLIQARWPRASDPGDSWLLVHVLATVIVTTPQFGALWFYRPNFTNYVVPLVVQLAWLVPYRFIAARAERRASAWLGVAIVPLGLLAGAGNEHTGIGLAVAAIACMYITWCRDRRLPVWSIVGVVALVAGYVALLTAPGQLERYAGLAAEQTTFERVAARGVVGNFAIVWVFVVWCSPMVLLVAWVARRQLRRLPVRAAAGFAAAAAAMVATALAAPRVPLRLLAAPGMMVALTLGVFMVDLTSDPANARRLRIASLAIATVILATTLVIFVVTGIEGRTRLKRIETAPAGSVVCVKRYTFAGPSAFTWGDDFRSPVIIDRVARQYGLAGIDLACPSR